MRAGCLPPSRVATDLPPSEQPEEGPGTLTAEQCPGGNRATPGRSNRYEEMIKWEADLRLMVMAKTD
ncbi:hypothetical protein KIL84_005256 [Mauremys mutica]|uniref:Uncharacterized protein n=1 Tax=Mauremys mutica TaxID=74926 RepID=A0A9D4B5X8_9SAUR|nr:hypothetical protein KIL84_005256 [Mauremys mutica]